MTEQHTTVLKFGGTSIATTDHVRRIAKHLAGRKESGNALVVVVSAMGQTTDNLIAMAGAVSELPDGRDLDLLMATGEQISISLLSLALKELGHDAIALTGMQAGILTCNTHTKARISGIDTAGINAHLAQGKIVVVAGFQGISEEGEITTLGRGGSDTTAVCLAAALSCPCEIYTDVNGVYTVDPRLFPEARKLDTISYDEMLEMASRGAKVLETRSVELAHKYNVPLLVAHYDMATTGTLIKEKDSDMEKTVVTGLSVDENVLMVSMNMVPYTSSNVAKLFALFASKNVNIDMISQTAPYNSFVNISFTSRLDDKHVVKSLMGNICAEFPTIDYLLDSEVIKISVVGVGMMSQSGVASRLFSLFADNQVDFYQVTTSEISISYTINTYDRDKIVHLIATEFEL